MTLALITGGSGHVGANLSRKLLAKGHKVRCIDFDGDHRAFEGYDIELIKGDITDKDSLKKCFKNVDIVFHTAAAIILDRRYESFLRNVNVEGTKNVCQASIESDVKKLIHFSSIDAFNRFPIEEPLYETKELVSSKKSVPYDLSKADGHKIVLDFIKKGLDATIIHPTSIFGPNDFKLGLPMQGIANIANGKIPFMPNWGYNFVDVRDLCDTAISAIENGRKGQNYLVGGEYFTYLEIGKEISKKLNKKTIISKIPDFLFYPAIFFYYVDSIIKKRPTFLSRDAFHTGRTGNKIITSELAKKELGHNPRPFVETVSDTVDFFIERGFVEV